MSMALPQHSMPGVNAKPLPPIAGQACAGMCFSVLAASRLPFSFAEAWTIAI